MGFTKQLLIEQQEAGFSYSGNHLVCISCVRDEWLRHHVLQNGSESRCDFCRDEAVCIPVHDLFAEMGTRIQGEYRPYSMSDEVPGPEWEIEPPTVPSHDLLTELGDPLGEGELAETFESAFTEDWVALDALVGTKSERLVWGWEGFVALLKTESRFVFLHPLAPGHETYGAEINPARMLDELGRVLLKVGLVVPYHAGQAVYRARKHSPEERLTTPADLGAPPPSKTPAQRMNPAGIPYYYGAADEQTALAEVRGLDGDVATVARWITVRDSFVLDLTRLPLLPSIFDAERAHLRSELKFVERFATDIAKPIRAHDNPEVDYVPTQVVAEFVRHCLRTASGDRVEGMLYPSAARPGPANVVFFNDFRPDCDSPVLRLAGPPMTFTAVAMHTEWEKFRNA
jgi:hypothetical protein